MIRVVLLASAFVAALGGDNLNRPQDSFSWPIHAVRRDPFLPDLPPAPRPSPQIAPSARMKVYVVVEYIHGHKVLKYTNIPPKGRSHAHGDR